MLDNLVTGSVDNIEHLFGRPGFTFVEHDVSNYIWVPGEVDAVMHLASPASPKDYLEKPIQTLKVGSLGTHNTLGLAKARARSTSSRPRARCTAIRRSIRSRRRTGVT